MEADGLISRNVRNTNPPLIVEYSLSELGMTLKPVLSVMEDWGNLYKATIIA